MTKLQQICISEKFGNFGATLKISNLMANLSSQHIQTPMVGKTVSDIFIFPTHLFHFFLLNWWKYEIQMKENFGAIQQNLKFKYFLFYNFKILNMQCPSKRYIFFWNRFMNFDEYAIRLYIWATCEQQSRRLGAKQSLFLLHFVSGIWVWVLFVGAV